MDLPTLLRQNLVGGRYIIDGDTSYMLIDANANKVVGGCEAEWYNPLRATGLVHKHIEQTLKSLDELAIVCENAKQDEIASTIYTIAAGLRLAQRVAIEGVENLVPKG